GNGGPDAGPIDDDPDRARRGRHGFGHQQGNIRIVDRILAVGPVVAHLMPIALQRLDELLLELKSAVVGSNDHTWHLRVSLHSCTGACRFCRISRVSWQAPMPALRGRLTR